MATIWFVITGALLVGFALAGTELKRLPVTPSMFYLAAGAWLGPWGVDLLHIDALDDTAMLERLTEIAVIISLFTAGLKLRLPVTDRRWRVAVGLAGVAMVLTIAGITAFGMAVGLPLAAALLLGAILAPTDPVLASDVQVGARARCRAGAVQPDRRSRPQRRHRVPVRHARPWAAGPPRARRERLALVERRPDLGGGRRTWRRHACAAPALPGSSSTCGASTRRPSASTSFSRSG